MAGEEAQVRLKYIVGLSATVAIGFVALGYCFGYYNAFTKILHRQYVRNNVSVIEDEALFNSLISGLIPFGAIFGSQVINPIAVKGRRLAMICTSITFICGTFLTLFFNMYLLILGRFLMGMCVGAYVTVCPLFISEIAPPSLSGPLGSFNQMGAVTGIFLAFGLPFLMPLPNDPDAETSLRWKYMFALPILIGTNQLVMFLFVYKYDTPKFYKDQGDLDNMNNILSLIYEEGADIAILSGRNQDNGNSSYSGKIETLDKEEDKHNEDSLSDEAPTHEPKGSMEKGKSFSEWPVHYKKALFIGSLMSVLQQMTGINAVTFFSNEIFTNGETGNDAEFKARMGTLLVGIFAFLGTLSSIPLLKYFGRVIFIQGSEAVMAICLALSGICAITGSQLGIIFLTLVFVYTFNLGYGPVLWIYTSEILDSYGCSMVGLLNMLFTFVYGAFTNLAFKYFTAPGVYFTLTLVQIGTMVFVHTYVKETKGKSKEECEHLYAE